MGAVENFASSIRPSNDPSPDVFCQVGSRRQRTRLHAVAKINNVAAPSVAAIEKCAISKGENANSTSAKFAAVLENKRSAAHHTSPAKARPSRTFMARAREA